MEKKIARTLNQLAKELGVGEEIMLAAWQKREEYKEIFVPKDNLRLRRVLEPNPELKLVQRKLNRTIFSHWQLSDAAHAFRKKRSLVSFLYPHKKSVEFISIDLENAYGQINANRLSEILGRKISSESLIKVIVDLTIFDDQLPQGAATSPYLFNLSCKELDDFLSDFASKNALIYTRYADDLCFSCEKFKNIKDFIPQIIKACQKFDFEVNERKIKWQSARYQTPEICGVLVDKGKLRISKRGGIDLIRAFIFQAINDPTILIEQVEGRLSLIRKLHRAEGWLKKDSIGYVPKRLRKIYAKFRQVRRLKPRNFI